MPNSTPCVWKRFGHCKGVKIVWRGLNDPHLCVEIWTEDDENWFMSDISSFSSYWLPELLELLKAANAWMKNNAQKEADGYGYTACPPTNK